MARDLKGKLERRGSFASWEDVVADIPPRPLDEPVGAPKETYKNKTYLLREDQVEKIAELADREGAKLNEFVRALLDYVLEEVDSGRVVIQVGTTRVRRSERG